MSAAGERFESSLRPRRLGGLWRNPSFLKLWAGQTISQFGSQVSLLAIPLLAALTLSATPTQMGLLTAVATLPTLVLALPAGVWVDRLPHRPIMIAADLGRAMILLSVLLLVVGPPANRALVRHCCRGCRVGAVA